MNVRLANALLATATTVRVPPSLLAGRRAALHASRMQFDDATPLGFESYGGAKPPSEKQVQYAQRLAQQTAMELPQDALMDSMACSRFIDDALSRTPPSPKQIEFATTIARQLNLEMPEGVTSNAKACSEFISANQMLMGGGGGGGYGASSSSGGGNYPPRAASTGREPSEKQILYAASLAAARNVGLSAEQLQDKVAMSSFIDECVREANSGGATPPANAFPAAGAAGMAYAASGAGAAAGDPAEKDDLDALFGSGGAMVDDEAKDDDMGDINF